MTHKNDTVLETAWIDWDGNSDRACRLELYLDTDEQYRWYCEDDDGDCTGDCELSGDSIEEALELAWLTWRHWGISEDQR